MSTPSLRYYTDIAFEQLPITDEAAQAITNKFQELRIEYKEIRRSETRIRWLTSKMASAETWKAMMDEENSIKYQQYHDSLLRILCNAHHYLTNPSSPSHTTSLDAVTRAVTLLEDSPLFNSGHGAVFTRDGINELEASVMVSRGKKKRSVGVMGLRHVKNPIKLAREMLLRGEKDLDGGNGEHRGNRSARTPAAA
ncbi:hypothetical protein OIDMADRAFT_174086 [Oidiodendron maius Zn]|uniref:Uncharacterized protein n=1 Tax=Oidiodendron maius (strain Zn) TaxID=913774 RepID=A0A0C3DY29_OIDMZ|nr:hypothetical protein OIDMADRAFT_174086 [Oidiodendron maius Zn]